MPTDNDHINQLLKIILETPPPGPGLAYIILDDNRMTENNVLVLNPTLTLKELVGMLGKESRRLIKWLNVRITVDTTSGRGSIVESHRLNRDNFSVMVMSRVNWHKLVKMLPPSNKGPVSTLLTGIPVVDLNHQAEE